MALNSILKFQLLRLHYFITKSTFSRNRYIHTYIVVEPKTVHMFVLKVLTFRDFVAMSQRWAKLHSSAKNGLIFTNLKKFGTKKASGILTVLHISWRAIYDKVALASLTAIIIAQSWYIIRNTENMLCNIMAYISNTEYYTWIKIVGWSGEQRWF